MALDDLDLPYSDDQLREFVHDAVAREGTRHRPRWYAITGSHLYGFDSAGSDVDVRGFHTAPADAYASLEEPAPEVTVNMDGTTEGFEHVAEVDLRSYELKHFGELVVGANYNAIELVLCAPELVDGVSLEMDALRRIVTDELPLNVPHSYLGMARSNYYKHLDPEKPDSYSPVAKKYLYVYRGLLGAQYVQDTGTIEPDVAALAEAVDFGEPERVRELVEHKRGEGGPLPEDRRPVFDDLLADAFNAVEAPGPVEKTTYRGRIDEWMRKVRL